MSIPNLRKIHEFMKKKYEKGKKSSKEVMKFSQHYLEKKVFRNIKQNVR